MGRTTQQGHRALVPVGGLALAARSGGSSRGVVAGGTRWRLILALLGTLAIGLGAFISLAPTKRASTAARAPHAATLSAAARLAVSRGLGAELPGYRPVRSSTGYLAHNAGQGLIASFSDRGARIAVRDGAHASIALHAIGFGGVLHSAAALAKPLVRGNRVEYSRGGATEWFANGPSGVEQGFTIPARPLGTGSGALTLSLGLSGTLVVRRGASGGLVFVSADGKAMLRYSDLSVTDASGGALPAHMTVAHGRVLISVDARRARYPIRVDPLVSVAELYASPGLENEELGFSVAVSGKTVVAGAPGATVGGHASAGAAYVFTEGASGWSTSTQAAELLPSASEANAEFGHSVAISGKTIVVGSPDAAGFGPVNGAAFVFSEPEGGWAATAVQHQSAKLIDSEDQAFAEFGKSVAIDGETVVVGSPRYVNYIYKPTFKEHPETGAAFVFVQPAGGWSKGGAEQTQSFTLMETEKEYEEYEEEDFFGASVAIREREGEQTVVVVAPDAKVGENFKQGVAFAFNRPAGGWTGSPRQSSPGAVLTISGGAEGEKLGEASGKGPLAVEGRTVAISDSEIVIGAPEAKVGATEYEGKAYVFAEPTGGWEAQRAQTQAARLVPSDGKSLSEFGKAVAAEGPTVMVSGAGNGYVYSMAADGWDGELDQSSELEGYAFSIALTPGYAMVGAIGRQPPEEKGHPLQGAVEVVPLGPIVTTGLSSGLSTNSATIEGNVAPNHNAVSQCSFQYGTSTSYGMEAPCAQTVAGTGSSPTTVTAALSGLTLGTTYHYRAIASNASGTSYGADESFTTQVAAGGSGPATTNSVTTSTTTSTTPTTTTTTTPPTSAVLACTTAQIALVNVVQKGSHVLITGAARLVLAGKRVSIRFLATGKTVATATIGADGDFSASAPLPPAKLRGSNRARYEAVVGSLHSLNLKLERRMYMVSATSSGAHVALSGYVTGSFKAGTAVKILLRVTCSKEEVATKVKLTRSGRFTATVPAPTGAASQIAVYRATTTVLDHGHPETTYTLPTPPTG
jgi:hypothetical protein